MNRQIQIQVSGEVLSFLKKVTAHVSIFILALVGRSIFQYFPSVEPLIPLYLFLSYYGGRIFAIEGAIAFYFSNFLVYGGQGPWTIFQVIGTYLACYIAYRFPKRRYNLYLATIFGISVYELVVNIGWMFSVGFFNLYYAFIPAIPYSITHVISSLGFIIIFEYLFRWKR